MSIQKRYAIGFVFVMADRGTWKPPGRKALYVTVVVVVVFPFLVLEVKSWQGSA